MKDLKFLKGFVPGRSGSSVIWPWAVNRPPPEQDPRSENGYVLGARHPLPTQTQNRFIV